ncbi:MAG: M20/M25/M40 family metallo-hydrolase [Anaerolineae bacterium]
MPYIERRYRIAGSTTPGAPCLWRIVLSVALVVSAWAWTTTSVVAGSRVVDAPEAALTPGYSALPPSLTGDIFSETRYAPVVAETLSGIKSSALYEYVGDLSGEWPVEIAGAPYTLTTRYSFADEAIAMAESYARQHFEALDLPTVCHTYPLRDVERCNIVAEQAGVLEPGRVILLMAHLDSMSNDPMELAPGADDNASGSAAVMATAEALSRHDLPYTVRYVLTTGEEQGLYGSRAYAKALAADDENVVAVVNLDMIAFNSDDDPVLNVHTRDGTEGEADAAIAQVFADVVQTYGLDLIPAIVASNMRLSDHASFWAEGYPAIAATEDFNDFNGENYHKSWDRLATLDIVYYTDFARAAAATTLHLAGVIDVASDPILIQADEPITLSAVSHLVTEPVTYTWDLGDGELAYGPVISHTFDSSIGSSVAGYYPVTMTVMHSEGQLSVTRRLPIRVSNLFLPFMVRPYVPLKAGSEGGRITRHEKTSRNFSGCRLLRLALQDPPLGAPPLHLVPRGIERLLSSL